MKFIKENFNYHGKVLTYNNKFVARFKHMASNKPTFLSFLIKNFTEDEYFTALTDDTSPLELLETKGYVSAHIKKMLKQAGYSPDREGRASYMQDRLPALQFFTERNNIINVDKV